MKRMIYLCASLTMLFGGMCVASAQEQGTPKAADETKKLYDGDFFLGIGGGINIYMGEQDGEMKLHHRLAPAMDVYFGKWLKPWFGLRCAYSGGQGFGVTNADSGNIFSTGTVYEKPGTEKYRYWQKFDFFGVRFDAMFKVTDFSGKKDPFYNLCPYVGVGIHKVYNTPLEETCIGVTAGLYNTFSLSDSFDIVLDIHETAVPENFEHETGVREGRNPNGLFSFDGIFTASLGVAFRF